MMMMTTTTAAAAATTTTIIIIKIDVFNATWIFSWFFYDMLHEDIMLQKEKTANFILLILSIKQTQTI